ncbi:hypothetical protein GCM10010440_41140 [Kitasatospora cinereorecta]
MSESGQSSAVSASAPLSPSARSTVAVLGPGGVGGLLAALLSRAGHRVICIAREETAAVLRRDGIRVRSRQFGEFTAAVEADTELRERVDLCLVTVKSTALSAAHDRVPPRLLADGVLVPLLNGVEHIDTLRGRFGPDRVVPAVVRVEATRTAPGVVEHGSPFVEIDLAGERERLGPAAALLTDAGVTTRVLADENAALWGKLAFLAPFALLTTRYRQPIGAVRTERRGELAALVGETVAVARACGAPMSAEDVLRRYDAFPADSRSSMQRDAEAGRPLELDAIGGALLRAAGRHGVPVPSTGRLVTELASLPGAPGASSSAQDHGRTRRSYDTVAEEYRSRIGGELAHKPLDRALLTALLEQAGTEHPVADLGCGPGHVTAWLAERGVRAVGIDLSPAMVAIARRDHGATGSGDHGAAEFREGDLLRLPAADGEFGAAVALYSVIHLEPSELRGAFAEMRRVLRPSGLLLVAFHLGSEVNRLTEWWGHNVDLDFHFLAAETVAEALREAGFTVEARLERASHPQEASTRRAYLLARRDVGAPA